MNVHSNIDGGEDLLAQRSRLLQVTERLERFERLQAPVTSRFESSFLEARWLGWKVNLTAQAWFALVLVLRWQPRSLRQPERAVNSRRQSPSRTRPVGPVSLQFEPVSVRFEPGVRLVGIDKDQKA